ncbi:substrate-binding periplasmic protein [Shewanella litorisediminis]|uniref:Transporter substrate-binding domain-containing protein n=2 Tax=Shewanella litorisediminis TaxID=1173586 RepID=A0ABX7G7Q7_9GAMM|nr:transporter substrate-binding domain-containing protein [Shewanella litorisediminis]QRH03283.1 transporter substrate-binding domain-containing protein [Shewanella litorisediminis]
MLPRQLLSGPVRLLKSMWLLLILLTAGLGVPNEVNATVVRLTSLHWPPYSGQGLPSEGASVAVAKAAFAAMGYQLEVDFYPWSRAVKLAHQSNTPYVGYFPEYYFDTVQFVFSHPMGMSPLGLLEHKNRPISWVSVKDLRNYRLGVVQDYVNTEELDKAIADDLQPAEKVTSDEFNIKKVAAGRIDAAVIDVYVMRYLLKQNRLQGVADKVQMNSQLLANKNLYIAFKNTPEGLRWQAIFNEGLQRIDAAEVMANHLPE